jgi:AcrR family transcriptional regulator
MTGSATNPHTRARQPRADGERTRAAILRAAASLATVDGLEGLSIGHLAGAIGMSKSGLYAHFGSKQELQLATVQEAGRIFADEVVQPALAAPAGLAQLVAVCEAFFDHLQRRTFPGGCFFAGAALEMGTRPGPVKEAVSAFQSGFVELIKGFTATAIEQGELPAGEDPQRLAFELNGIILATDTNFVLHDDPAVLDLARQVVRRRLGLDRSLGVGVSAVPGDQFVQDGRELMQAVQVSPGQLPQDAVAFTGQADPDHAAVVSVRRPLHQPGGFGPVDKLDRAVRPQEQVSGEISHRRRQVPAVSFDRDK